MPPLIDNLFEAYHDQPLCFITSPMRKIDPATTILADRRQADSSASAGSAASVTGRPGAIVRASLAISHGSAERALDARVGTSAPISGASARSMASMSLSRMAAKTRGDFPKPDVRRNAA